jgi:hypothetical protein
MSRLAKLARGYSISSELTYTFSHIHYRGIIQCCSEYTGLYSRKRKASEKEDFKIGSKSTPCGSGMLIQDSGFEDFIPDPGSRVKEATDYGSATLNRQGI